MTFRFYIHFLPFAPQKMGFWVQKGKICNFSQFSILLLSEALVPLLCFPKGWKIFVSGEDLQTIILSTERPLYHAGELRYGPPKFFEENQKFQKMQSSYHLSPSILMCLYSPKWYSEAPIDICENIYHYTVGH